jgi:hypothetical protein
MEHQFRRFNEALQRLTEASKPTVRAGYAAFMARRYGGRPELRAQLLELLGTWRYTLDENGQAVTNE